MIDATKLGAIIMHPGDDLRELASLAGGHPKSFYRGANFNDADLRGQDLRGFALDASTFDRARINKTTRTDRKYRELAGLKRTTLRVPVGLTIIKGLEECGVQIEKPLKQFFGDLVEEAIFDRARHRRDTTRFGASGSPVFDFDPQTTSVKLHSAQNVLDNENLVKHLEISLVSKNAKGSVSFRSDDIVGFAAVTGQTLAYLGGEIQGVNLAGAKASIILLEYFSKKYKTFEKRQENILL